MFDDPKNIERMKKWKIGDPMINEHDFWQDEDYVAPDKEKEKMVLQLVYMPAARLYDHGPLHQALHETDQQPRPGVLGVGPHLYEGRNQIPALIQEDACAIHSPRARKDEQNVCGGYEENGETPHLDRYP